MNRSLSRQQEAESSAPNDAYGPGTRFLAWAAGLTGALIGLLLLVLPAQAADLPNEALRAHASLYGVVFIALGLLLLSWQILPTRQAWLPPISFLLFAFAVALAVQGYARTQSWNTAGVFSLQVVALLIGAAGVERWLKFRPDLLTALVAAGRLLLGLMLLLFPSLWMGSVYQFVQPHAGLWGITFLAVGGLLLVRLLCHTHAWSRLLPLPAAVAMVAWAYETSIRTHLLTGAITAIVLALAVVAEPFVPAAWLRPPQGRLRAKLIAGSLLFVSVTLLLLVFGVLQQTDAAYRNRAERDLSAATLIAASNLSDFVTAHQRAAALLSTLPAIRSMDPAQAGPILRQVVVADPAVALAAVSNTTGMTIATSSELQLPSTGAPSPGVARILQTHVPATEVRQSPSLGAPVLAVRAPIWTSDGVFLGFYTTIVSLESLNSNFGSLPLGDGGQIIVVDDHGRVIVHPNGGMVSSRADLSNLPPIEAARRGVLTPQVYQDGATVWLSSPTLVPDTGWIVLTQKPLSTILAPANAARERAFWFLILMLITAGGAVVVFSGALTRPITELAQAARLLGKGSYTAPLPAAGNDEIGALVRAFGETRARLHAQTVERERAESALRSSEERFRTIVETALEGIWTLDTENRIAFANRRIADMLGYAVSELIGRPVFTFMDGREHALAGQSLERRRRGIAEVQEVRLYRHGGTEIWMRVAASPLFDHDGEFAGSLAMLTDVTEQKRSIAERERLLVAEQSARGDLAERTRALEAKTAEQDAFLYTVSHDLKAPLVSIRGMAELLEQDAAERLVGDDRFYLTRIIENTRHLATLLEDLLTLSRIGRVDSAVEPVALESVLSRARHQLAVQLASRDCELTIDRSLPAVSGNPERLTEIFMNLLDNAIKYTPTDRRPVLHVGARVVDGFAECWLQDNGVGIAPEHRGRVFELFARLPDGKRLHANGSGAGLAIVSRIIQVHGGKIWLDNSPEGGSLFRFTLPMAPVELPPSDTAKDGATLVANSAG